MRAANQLKRQTPAVGLVQPTPAIVALGRADPAVIVSPRTTAARLWVKHGFDAEREHDLGVYADVIELRALAAALLRRFGSKLRKPERRVLVGLLGDRATTVTREDFATLVRIEIGLPIRASVR